MGMRSRFNSLSKRRKVAVITGCTLFTLLTLCGCCFASLLATSSANLGQRNSLSTLSQFFATENIPVVQNLGKSHEQIVQDAFVLRMDEDYAKNYADVDKFEGTFIANSKVETDFRVKTDRADIVGDFDLDSKTNINFKDQITQNKTKLSGTFEYGVVSVDLKNNPVEFEAITQKDNKDIYFRVNATDKLIDTLFSQSGVEYDAIEKETGINIKEYFNTYLKYNQEEFEAEYKKLYRTDFPASSKKYSEEDLKEFSKDIIESYNKTISSKFSNFAKVEYMGREDVNGISSMKYKITLDKDKFRDALIDFADAMPDVFAENRKLFRDDETCKKNEDLKLEGFNVKRTASPGFCNDEEIAAMKKSYKDARPEMVKSFTEFFKSIDIEDFYLNIVPSSNSIIKFTFTVKVNDYGKKEINKNSGTGSSRFELENLSVRVSADYQVKLNPEEIKIPTDAKNIIELFRDIYAYQKKLENSRADTIPTGFQDV